MRIIFYSLAAVCFLVALRQLQNLKHTRNQLMLFIFMTAALALSIYQLLFDGLFLRLPHLFLVINVFALMAITAIYFYASWLADKEFALTRRRIFAVLAIAAVYAAILSPFWFLRAQEKILLVGEIIHLQVLYTARDPEIFGISVFKISNAYFALVGVAALALSCRVVFRAAQAQAKKRVRYAAVLFAVSLSAAAIGTVGITVNSLALILIAGVLLSSAFCGLYVIGEIAEREGL